MGYGLISNSANALARKPLTAFKGTCELKTSLFERSEFSLALALDVQDFK
jgi:hypothetical protein